jgi:hypothetical protein
MTKLSEMLSNPAFIPLSKGGHKTRTEGLCLMEAAAWWAGEPHGDKPLCVDQKLAILARHLNDTMLDHYREGFAALVPALTGTAGDGLSFHRLAIAKRFVVEVLIPEMMTYPESEGEYPTPRLFTPIEFFVIWCSQDVSAQDALLEYKFSDEALLAGQELIAKHFADLCDPEIVRAGLEAPAEPAALEVAEAASEGQEEAISTVVPIEEDVLALV